MRKHRSGHGSYKLGVGPYRMKDNGQKMRSNLVDITAELIHETDQAILVSEDGEARVWLPKSQVEYVRKGAGSAIVEVTLPQWLAEDKGLV